MSTCIECGVEYVYQRSQPLQGYVGSYSFCPEHAKSLRVDIRNYKKREWDRHDGSRFDLTAEEVDLLRNGSCECCGETESRKCLGMKDFTLGYIYRNMRVLCEYCAWWTYKHDRLDRIAYMRKIISYIDSGVLKAD